MGTRSLTYIHDTSFDEAPFCAIYRQFDGYPTGAGADIKATLGAKTLVNGISPGDKDKVINGMHCAAAQLVKSLKDEAGGIYIQHPDTPTDGVDYVYRLAANGKPREGGCVHLRVIQRYSDKILYDGPLSDFDPEAAEASDE